jgi:glycosyltransferase involved in cell wall biosynthesis
MRIVALVKSLDHVCCRYRLAAFRPYLHEAGYQLALRPWPKRWWSQFWLRRDLGRADILILQRRLPPAWELSLLRHSAPYLLYDFDDAVFARDSYAPKGSNSPSRARGFANVVRAANAVIAGNHFLQEHAALWARPERIHLVPTCLDPSRYPLAGHTARGRDVELVWIGSSSTLQGMSRIRPMLETIGRRWPDRRLKIICDRFLDLQHLQVVRCRWSEASEAADLARADIGISWIPDDLWSQGKCGLKILQYMAAGLPVVANPVGLQASLVRHGETGFLVKTPGEWLEAIDCLAADPALRRRLGQAGRAYIEANFHLTRGAARWLQLLDGLRNPLAEQESARRIAKVPATARLEFPLA